MFLLKKWVVMFSVITMAIFLTACGDEEEAKEDLDGEVLEESMEHLPISDAFEEHQIWISTSDNPERNSSIDFIFVFEDEEVTRYSVSGLTIEEFNDLSDDEVIQYVDEHSSDIMSGQYTLDIKMDSVGQDVENIDVVLDNYTTISKFDFVHLLEEAAELFHEEFTYNRDASDEDNLEAYNSLSNEQDGYNPNRVRELEDSPDGKLLVTTTPEDETLFILSLNHQPITQKIFDTTYTGLMTGKIEDFDGILLTRVQDDSPEFELDSLDSDKENVTIEEAEED